MFLESLAFKAKLHCLLVILDIAGQFTYIAAQGRHLYHAVQSKEFAVYLQELLKHAHELSKALFLF